MTEQTPNSHFETFPKKIISQVIIPTIMRKALMKAGLREDEVLEFLAWAFDSKIPVTFREICIEWNLKFGDKLWLSETSMYTRDQLIDFFYRMGKVFKDVKNNKS